MKYEVRVCSCGRIHFLDKELIDAAIAENKELLMICGGCGHVTVIGEVEYDPCQCGENFDIKPIYYKAFIDQGICVFMKTGYSATAYNDGFYDFNYPVWEFMYKLSEEVTKEEIISTIEDHKKRMSTVDMYSLISLLNDDQLEALTKADIHGLDWSGTPWAVKYV